MDPPETDSPENDSPEAPRVTYARTYSKIATLVPVTPVFSGNPRIVFGPPHPGPSPLPLMAPSHLLGPPHLLEVPQVQVIDSDEEDSRAAKKIRKIPRDPATNLSDFSIDNIIDLEPPPPMKVVTFADVPRYFKSFRFSVSSGVSDENVSGESSKNNPGGSSENISGESSENDPGGSAENIETSYLEGYSPISDA